MRLCCATAHVNHHPVGQHVRPFTDALRMQRARCFTPRYYDARSKDSDARQSASVAMRAKMPRRGAQQSAYVAAFCLRDAIRRDIAALQRAMLMR